MGDNQEIPKPSFKGLGKGSQTILQHFKGTFVGSPGKSEFNAIQYYFQFVNLQVFKTDGDQPYLFPNAEIRVKYSSRENSGWGHLGDSVAMAMGVATRDDVDFDKLMGKNMEWQRVDNVPYGKGKDGNPMLGTDWKCLWIEGFTPKVQAPAGTVGAVTPVASQTLSPQVIAIQLLDGKTALDFWKAALTNDTIKKDPVLASQILDNTFVDTLKNAGKVLVDANGIHHVAK
jgi:hypothetical protein